MLSERVAAGVLPPVEERLSKEPLVLGKQIGTYGGTLFMASPWRAKTYGAEPYSLFGLRIPSYGWVYEMYPTLAKSAVATEKGRVWTIQLREGTKWSDGEPFYADDIIFWWEDVYTMEEAPAFYTRAQQNSGVYKDVRKIDDYTVVFEFTTPSNVMFYVWAGKALAGFAEHYWEREIESAWTQESERRIDAYLAGDRIPSPTFRSSDTFTTVTVDPACRAGPLPPVRQVPDR